MRLTTLIIILMVCWVTISHAELPAPPIIKDVDRALQQYMQDIYNNRNIIPITTTVPNGNRIGHKGELVIYNNALWFNNSSTNSVLWLQL